MQIHYLILGFALALTGCAAGVARGGDIARSHYVWTWRDSTKMLEPDMRGDSLVMGSRYHRRFVRLDPRTGAVVERTDSVAWHRFVPHYKDSSLRDYLAVIRAGTGIVVDSIGDYRAYHASGRQIGLGTNLVLGHVYTVPLPDDFAMRDLRVIDENPFGRGSPSVRSLRYRPRTGGPGVTVQFPRRETVGPWWYRPYGRSGLLVWYTRIIEGRLHDELALLDLARVYDEARANDLLDPE